MELEIQRVILNLPVQDKQHQEKDAKKSAEQRRSALEKSKPQKEKPREVQTYSPEEMEIYLNRLFGSNLLFNKKLKFAVNRELNQVIVKIIDGSTDEVVKEIPSEEIQRLQAKVNEAIGLLIDEKI